MEELIQSGQELLSWLTSLAKLNDYHRQKAIERGVIVSTKIRKEFLCSVQQGQFILGGEVVKATFTNIGGGCWQVSVGKLKD